MPASRLSGVCRSVRDNRTAWAVAFSVLLAGCAMTLLLAQFSLRHYQEQLRQRFELLANDRFSRIQERLDGQEQRLNSLRRFFLYSDAVSRKEFDGFAHPMLAWTQAYAWTPYVTDAERDAFETAIRNSDVHDYRIRELSDDGRLVPAARQADYFPVRYMQMRGGQATPFGFDIKSEPRRRAALEHALRSGGMAATPRMTLLGLPAPNFDGVLVVAPVWSLVADHDSAKLLGTVEAVIGLDSLMSEGLPSAVTDNLALTLVDMGSTSQPEVLYRSRSQPAKGALRLTTSLRLADRDYALEAHPTAFFYSSNPPVTQGVVMLGILSSLMLSALLFTLIGQRQRALRLVDLRTAELRVLSQTDTLTGVYNRRYFQERLQHELQGAAEEGGQLSVIMFDIDHFKHINDRFGHATGDRVLQDICQRIVQRLRPGDVFCRLGGEEFVVLCPNTNAARAQKAACELRDSLRKELVEEVGRVTASFGIASWRDGETADTLLRRADKRVYQAKQNGRDRVESPS